MDEMIEKCVVEDPRVVRERELVQLVRDWRDFLRHTALSIGERHALEIWKIEWIERHLDLEKRSQKLLDEG
jgi:hypothetical protein